jgi:hypothetical protein
VGRLTPPLRVSHGATGRQESAEASSSSLTGIAGNIFTALPGGRCLWCTGFISKEKLDLETGGRGRSYLRTADGANVYVAPFNGTLASEAAAEVLRLLVGTRRGTEFRKIYDGFSGTCSSASFASVTIAKCAGGHLLSVILFGNEQIPVASMNAARRITLDRINVSVVRVSAC